MIFFSLLRQSRQAVMDMNTEPSQNEQIIWDDPTAREERARLVSNLQWPNSPSQCSEQIQTNVNNTDEPPVRKPLTEMETADSGKIRDTVGLCHSVKMNIISRSKGEQYF